MEEQDGDWDEAAGAAGAAGAAEAGEAGGAGGAGGAEGAGVYSQAEKVTNSNAL